MTSRRPGRTFVFLGISGSGKGTQAKFLERRIRGRILSTGVAFRAVARTRTFLGRYVADVMRRGGLMPYWGPVYFWLHDSFAHLRREEHIIFEGSPRRIEEAPILDQFMRDLGRPLPIAIYIKLSPREARRRLLERRRSDDTLRAITNRFAFFREHVTGVIRYYQRRDRLITVNGDQSPEAVWRDIRNALRV